MFHISGKSGFWRAVGAISALGWSNTDGSRASLLSFQHGVTLIDELFELFLLLSNAPRCSFFILRARRCSSLFD
jgi:hypothetical protein